MTDLSLTIAMSSYDHVSALTSGTVRIAGVNPLFVDLPIPEMFRRFREWEVSEMSSAKYLSLRSAGDDSVQAIPVFTSRMFRHSSIFVRRDRIKEPADLRGAVVGVPGWSMTAGVWARGLLADMYDVAPQEISWVQGGLDRPGRREAVPPKALPDDVRLNSVQDVSLEAMLWAGDLDAVITPSVPESFRASVATGGEVGLLFADVPAAEREYFAATAILPIMHLVVVRSDVVAAYPWLHTNLYRAFEVAKRQYFARLEDISASRTPLPWIGSHLAKLRRVLGPDPWPYGLEPNRAALDALVRHCGEQGLLQSEVSIDEVFLPVETFVDGNA